MTKLRDEQISAASAIAGLIDRETSLRPELQILACARMAGTFLFRSFALALNPATPGTLLKAETAAQSGPALIGLLESSLSRLGISASTSGLDLNKLQPLPDAPAFLDSQRQWEPRLAVLRQQFSLGLEEMAQACAVATALLIKKSEQSVPVAAITGRAIYGFIEGSKTVPESFH